MFSSDNGKLNILPFMVCPTAFTNQETNMIIGSAELEKQINTIISITKGYVCPLIGVAYWYSNKLIIAHVIYSSMLDSKTERGGMLVIYGGQIEFETFFHYKNICESFFDELHTFINKQFDAEASLRGIDKIIERCQENISIKEIIDEDILLNLYRQIESRYYFKRNYKFLRNIKNPLRWIYHKVFSIQEIRPFVEIQDTKVFWRKLDSMLTKVDRENPNTSGLGTSTN